MVRLVFSYNDNQISLQHRSQYTYIRRMYIHYVIINVMLKLKKIILNRNVIFVNILC